MADLVSKNGHFGAVFMMIVLKIQDDRVCRVGVFNGGRCPSIAVGLQKECKSVFNMACTMLKRYPEPHGQVTAYNRSPVH